MSRPLELQESELIFDILVEECGAPDRLRDEFIRYHGERQLHYPTEYRFQGDLGFGGKFWNGFGRNGWSVSSYFEDRTKVGNKVQKANARLEALRARLTMP